MTQSLLVERERELAQLAALLGRARDGDGGVAIVEGPAGVGKTALLEAVAGNASAFRVLRGRCGEVERELSFGLVRDLLQPALTAASPSCRRRWLSGAARPAAVVLGAEADDPVDPVSVMYGLYWLLAAVAEDGPLLLIADDVHWSDAASLRWLAYVARRLDGLPVALVAASRPFEAGDSGLVALVAASEDAVLLRPASLTLRGTGELIASRTAVAPEAAFVRACHAATGGNPWLLGELLDAVADAAPDVRQAPLRVLDELGGERLRRAVLVRMGRLGEVAVRLARAVAVLGDGCELRDAAALAELGEEGAAAVPVLVAAGILADSPELAFAHPLVRSAVYLDVPAAVRRTLHARAGAVLAAAGAEAETVASQLLTAAPVGEPWALASLREAARIAVARGAPRSAVAFLRRALDERPDASARAELLRALGNALARLGDPEAAAVLDQALECTEDHGDRVAIVEASIDALSGSGRVDDARRLLVATLTGPRAGDPDLDMRLAAQLAVLRALHGGGAGDVFVDALRDRAATLDPGSFTGRFAAAALASLEAYCGASAAEVRRLARVAVGDADRHAADARSGRPLHMALVALALAGDPEPALRGATAGVEASRARGSLMGQAFGLASRSLIHVAAGRVADAENDGRAARAVVADTGLDGAAIGATAAIGWALIERGEAREALELLGTARPAGLAGIALGCLRARALLVLHRPREALLELEALAERAERAGWRSSCALPWRSLQACAALAGGDRLAARRLAADELADAERFGAAHELGRALRLMAIVEGGREATPRLRQAVAVLRNADARLELAYALVDEGAALRRAGERSRAREPLREGMELAHADGATALVERARTELRAAGARPRSVARSGVDALTPSERRIAELAAEGLTNRDIAQALFVTVRTVEMHLSAAYRKLDGPPHTALPDALASGSSPLGGA